MVAERTLTNYVKNNLVDLYWNAIDKFLGKTNYDLLNLRLNQIEVISKIEINTLEVKSVPVSNGPKDSIKFDILVEADLEVYDKYFYRNDLSESVRQWFCVECNGSLGKKLKDSQCSNVSIYDGKLYDKNVMSQRLVPIMNKDDCENYASKFVQKYYPDIFNSGEWLNPTEMAKRMGLTVVEKSITKDHSVFGQIFFEDSYAQFYDSKNDCFYTEKINSGTIVVEPEIVFLRNLGAKFNTIVHECVHWKLHKKAFQLEKLFNSELTKFSCLTDGGIQENNSEAVKWIEWQANTIAPKIQMPLEVFKKRVEETILKYKKKGVFGELVLIEPVIDDLAQSFMVSRLAAKIRMLDLGYEEARGAFVFVDGRYVPTHTTSKGKVLENNQTFSIPINDLGIQSVVNLELKEKLSSGIYTYVDSHVVLNLPLYVEKDIFGQERITDYARKHMEECCLLFMVSPKDNADFKDYFSICVLNRDKNSPIELNFTYVNGFENSTPEKQGDAFKRMMADNHKFFMSMTNDPKKSLKDAFKWKKKQQKELAEELHISEDTISRCVNGTTSNLNTLILICLGLHLPFDVSMKIISDSGFQFKNSNPDHLYYKLVLQVMYTKEVEEIQEFLSQQGVATL